MSHEPEQAPYGSWKSELAARDVARGAALPEWLDFVGEEVWWTESLPHDGGRNALVRRGPDGAPQEVLPPGWNVRSGFDEYGARPWLPLSGHPGDGIVFTHWGDQRVHRWRPGSRPEPVSPAGPPHAVHRYGDFAVVGTEVWCVRQTVPTAARRDGSAGPRRELVALPLDGSAAEHPEAVRVLAAGHRFMTGPRVAPGGRKVAWLGWNHPDMPWDSTELMVADISPEGRVLPPVRMTGGGGRSVAQVEWATDGSGRLFAVTDPDGWWNLHEITPDGGVRNLCRRTEECAEALWRIGSRWFLPLRDGGIALLTGVGERRLVHLAPDGTQSVVDPEGPYTEWSSPATDGRRIAGVAAGPAHRPAVVLVDPGGKGTEILRAPAHEHTALSATPFRRSYRAPGGEEVYAHVHPPHNPAYRGPDDELPPFLVLAHGGPTNRVPMIPHPHITYFTSRGIGVLDVQYGGSTGYGRAYRDRLRGGWGVVDVQDCATAVRGLIAEGLADPRRIAIRGASAGGWTAAASLIAEPELYRAAALHFPVLDADTWRLTTHDFESRYAETLIGGPPGNGDRYTQRSPVHGASSIRAPFALFQGAQDAICPPRQAEQLLERLDGARTAYDYEVFEGEGHGFRRAETVAHTLRTELRLYARVFGFTPAPE
ncbi:alpha/beta hydrolase family protein [Streptomyces salyersiae]|uniref:Prolyl oligopeptidase family serine peptidase n=1 Tax=Streptomyces salyersiae TaxID=3075530 RepID=A0ABU2RHE7_9ACTN|nr:prolyl oligopeptidase family serine peptidase [Streptomyces sp. DSM 41770]MDT0427339.1 prolyl oligopeptidase family serine peptidase [Streptomyces sp. DSM 41770]